MQKTAYDVCISVWSSDVCSSDLFGQRAEGQAKLVLCGGDFMVMLVARQSHFEHRRNHFGADVDGAVDRRNGEVTALGARPVREVAALIAESGNASCRERVCQ